MKIDKIKLIRSCLEKEERDFNNAIKKIVIARNESPIPMESHSDTSRIQADKMLGELNTKINTLEKLIYDLPVRIPDNFEKIELWNFVNLSKPNLQIKLILVPEGYGGREFDGVKLVTISTPLGKALYGKRINELITVNESGFLIKVIE
jgi:hypothetical protein